MPPHYRTHRDLTTRAEPLHDRLPAYVVIPVRRRRSVWLLEAVASSAHHMQQWLQPGAVEFPAKIAHIDVDNVAACVEPVLPHLIQDALPSQHVRRVSHEEFEERPLAWCQLDPLSVPPRDLGRFCSATNASGSAGTRFGTGGSELRGHCRSVIAGSIRRSW